MEQLILVSEDGKATGTAGKLAAHRGGGLLHLAFSILVFNPSGEVLLQRRAASKYHFKGLWSNTCCGHPRPGETVIGAGQRRLGEELGLTLSLQHVNQLIYAADDPASGLSEREYLHILRGRVPEDRPGLVPDPNEVSEWKWESLPALREERVLWPERYTPWLPLVLDSFQA